MTKVLSIERRHKPRTQVKNQSQIKPVVPESYDIFDQLDGTHPWQKAVPEGCLLYDVRVLPQGKVTYFNWDLAKEMGLVPEHHPHRLNRYLNEKLIETFSLRIINEWDIENKILYPKSVKKKNQYMATRYLQLQHPDKAGRTSGDGRCIWNGVVRHKGKTWDVSSRGTGVTALAPGVVLAGKPLRSGNNDHGYGCGMAEIDELYAAAIMAEIFHRNGIHTERILAIIDLGKGMGIGIRAGQNLLRPAHLFVHLRQSQHDRLKRATDYFIDRQCITGQWHFDRHSRRRYDLMLSQLVQSFARFAAHLERDYIFAWLDWDGDNVLADAGIIDYGSVRQFGLRHDQYRYDDIERFSTNLNEQKNKARQIIQTFAQLVDYLKTGKKRQVEAFRHHSAVKQFDQQFNHHLLDHFLYQVGFTLPKRQYLLAHYRPLVKKFYADFSKLESIKTYRRLKKVADGINRPAIFNMRQVLCRLPNYFANHFNDFKHSFMDPKELFKVMLSDFAAGRDKKLTRRLSKQILQMQKSYKRLLTRAAPKETLGHICRETADRAARLNRADRMTGNALIHVVEELLKARRKGFSDTAIQGVMDAIIADQTLSVQDRSQPPQSAPSKNQLLSHMLTLVVEHKEEI